MIRNWINLKGFGDFESPIQEQAREIVDGDYLRQQQEEEERGVTAATSLNWKGVLQKTWGVGKFGKNVEGGWDSYFWLEDSLFWNSGINCELKACELSWESEVVAAPQGHKKEEILGPY